MIVRATGHESQTLFLKFVSERLRILENLRLILFEVVA
jgi:hypothetical protein